MNIQNGAEYIFTCADLSEVGLTISGSELNMTGINLTYQPTYTNQCWKLYGPPACTKLLCKIGNQTAYLYIQDIAAGSPLQITTEEDHASRWCILDLIDENGFPYQKILLLDSERVDTGLYLLVSINPLLLQVNEEAPTEKNWRMLSTSTTVLIDTPIKLISQQDLKAVVPGGGTSATLKLIVAESPNMQLSISSPDGSSPVNGVLSGATLQFGGSMYLVGTGAGENVTLSEEPGDNRWRLEDDGFGNITAQCTTVSGENIGWLENDLDQPKLNAEKTNKSKQKWKFAKSGTGLVDD
ncbi:hypothetical protein [Owenweeksia hongkongensis]|uniref:hypothetical protein n=1 Tax=Owenweeksia hongkongensis TaxID=253245 RepID=UPI003A913D14